jgi:hypothetical protein
MRQQVSWPLGVGGRVPRRGRLPGNVGIALSIAQGLEPVFEAAYYDGRLGYPVDAERWTVFWECIAAGLLRAQRAAW